MTSLKQCLTASAVALALTLGLATSARADVFGACAIEGDAKTVDKLDPSIGVRLVGGAGTFTFTGIGECVGDTNKDGVPEYLSIDVIASGYYHNTICGTGKAVGIVNDIRNAPLKVQAAMEGKQFAVEFNEFEGTFYWEDGPIDVPIGSKTMPDPKDPLPEDWDPAGWVDLAMPTEKPDLPDVTAGECMKAFSVTGFVGAGDEG